MKATRKSSTRRGHVRPRSPRPAGAGNRIRETWDAAVEAVTSAEAEAERQLRLLLARNRIEPKKARAALAAVGKRVEKERRNLSRLVEEAVRGTLVALNIPSRHEVSELTRKVDELSRKIDGYRRSRPRRRAAPATAH